MHELASCPDSKLRSCNVQAHQVLREFGRRAKEQVMQSLGGP